MAVEAVAVEAVEVVEAVVGCRGFVACPVSGGIPLHFGVFSGSDCERFSVAVAVVGLWVLAVVIVGKVVDFRGACG